MVYAPAHGVPPNSNTSARSALYFKLNIDWRVRRARAVRYAQARAGATRRHYAPSEAHPPTLATRGVPCAEGLCGRRRRGEGGHTRWYYRYIPVLYPRGPARARRHATDEPRLSDSAGPTHSQFTHGCQGAHSFARSLPSRPRARITRRRQRKGMSHLRRDGERQRARDPLRRERRPPFLHTLAQVPTAVPSR